MDLVYCDINAKQDTLYIHLLENSLVKSGDVQGPAHPKNLSSRNVPNNNKLLANTLKHPILVFLICQKTTKNSFIKHI